MTAEIIVTAPDRIREGTWVKAEKVGERSLHF